ncbi:hypothetical protein BDY21DRAFT_291855 [Lineolata rhizophorae]|uniref:Uncharacterized protein n=1 Tax=Lineolata rhizophorae TaxID=578093 RepID=A0A6A6NQP3_9PEZI|nr:hypothetical protein BDY21DRAFT_291855 [Lineolata rhizophorae]
MSPISKSTFKKFLEVMPFSKVVQKTKSTDRDQRLGPSQTSKNDKTYNFRADKGSMLSDGGQEVIIQADKNADNKDVRESAQKDSHRIVAKVAVDPAKDLQCDSIIEDALKSFEENN